MQSPRITEKKKSLGLFLPLQGPPVWIMRDGLSVWCFSARPSVVVTIPRHIIESFRQQQRLQPARARRNEISSRTCICDLYESRTVPTRHLFHQRAYQRPIGSERFLCLEFGYLVFGAEFSLENLACRGRVHFNARSILLRCVLRDRMVNCSWNCRSLECLTYSFQGIRARLGRCLFNG